MYEHIFLSTPQTQKSTYLFKNVKEDLKLNMNTKT